MQDEAREHPLAEAIDRLTGRIMNGIIIAAAIIGLAIWSRPASGPALYQVVATSDGRVMRVNTGNGSIVSCDRASCSLVYRAGHDLDSPPGRSAAPTQPAAAPTPPAPASQAPAAQQQR